MDDEIIYSLKIDFGDTQKSIEDYSKSITALQAETKDLIEIQKTLEKSGDVLSSQYVENSKQIEINKQKLGEQQTIKKQLITVQEAEKNSVTQLTAQNKLLVVERNKLNSETKEGAAQIAKINSQLDTNTEKIKSNVSAQEKQKMGVGGYTAAIKEAIPGLAGVVDGTEKMTKSSLTFIATPIGAVIGALGLIIAALTSYFKGSAEGQDRFNQIMQVGSAIIGKVTDAISDLVGWLIDGLVKGFEWTLDLLAKWVPGFEKGLEVITKFLNLDRAKYIADLEAETHVLERQLIVRKAQLEAIIAENKLRAEDKSLDLQTRLKFLAEAKKAQEELTALEIKFAENKLAIIRATNAQSKSTHEALKLEAEAEAELFRVKKDAADKMKEVFTKNQELNTEFIKAQQEKEFILSAWRRLAVIEQNENEANLTQNLEQQIDIRKGLQTDFASASANIQAAITANANKAEAARTKFIELSNERALAAMSFTAGRAKGLFKENTIAYKALATFQAFVDTRAAAIAAYKSLVGIPVVGPVLAPIAAGVAIAFGAKQVADINGVKFARGGRAWASTIGGKPHALGGTKFWGEDGTSFEAEQGEGLFVLKRDAHASLISNFSKLNESFGGVSWMGMNRNRFAALGGNVSVPTNVGVANQIPEIVGTIMRGLPPVFVSVQDIDRVKYDRDISSSFGRVL